MAVTRHCENLALRRPRHIPGLDALRALAITAVLIYHLRPATLTGGFIGVDVFFVVSGFLITTLLIREVAKSGRINLPQFWLRRARRLFPALFVCVVTSVSVALLVSSQLLVGIGRQTLGALTFSNNWLEIFAGSSYFARTSPQLFVNFWSLAVEEQFYLIWPLIFGLLLAILPNVRKRMGLVLAIAVVSAIWMGLNTSAGEDATRAYYGTDTHLFGLMLGIALAYLWQQHSILDTDEFRRYSPWLSVASFALVITLMVTVNEDSLWPFRGGLFLACLATTVLIATLIQGTNPALGVLESGPIRWIGERSYGIYLWHWPVILIADALTPSLVPDSGGWWTVRLLALVTILTIAAISYTYLETPIRKRGFLACGRSAWHALRYGGWGYRTVGATLAAFMVLTPVAIAVAPQKSETQLQIEAGEALLAQENPSSDVTAAADETGESVTPSSAPKPTVDANIDTSVPDGKDISCYGDSLIITTIHAIRDRFPDIAINAKSNRQWPDGKALVEADLAAGTVRRAVILAFGTNAGLNDEAMLRSILDQLGPTRQVVLVNIYGKSTWIDEVNATYARVASDYPNVIVANWHDAISAHRELLQADGVHPGIEGAHLYADTIKAAFTQLSEQLQ
ncbi:MAG: acyltransferase family protein [Bowdeniella nasicola]|nr:acyltransferase family protein [Bowdeniella nasicola]